VELAEAAKYNDHVLYVFSIILGVGYNEQEIFHALLVSWRGYMVGKGTWKQYSFMAVAVPQMVTKFMETHDNPDMISKI
jgi:hypothetical protein